MQTHNEPLLGVRLKIERARRHLRELESSVGSFMNTSPYEIYTEETEAGDLLYRVRVTESLPIECSLVLGDAVHNLRSALDYLAYELVVADGGTPSDNTGFPIGRDVHALKSMILNKLGGASERTIRAVRALNPYRGGNDLLWKLHHLDIIDKHRLLLTVGSANRGLVLDVLDYLRSSTVADQDFIDLFRDLSMPFELCPDEREWPLQDGAELFRVLAQAREFPDVHPRFVFEIAFGGGDEVEGEEVFRTMQSIVETVEETVAQLAHLLAAPRPAH